MNIAVFEIRTDYISAVIGILITLQFYVIVNIFISLIPFLRKSGRFGRTISVFSLISALTGAAAFADRSFLNEIYVLSVVLIFAMLIIFSFIYTAGGVTGK